MKKPLVIPVYKVDTERGSMVRMSVKSRQLLLKTAKEKGVSAKLLVSLLVEHYIDDIVFKEIQ